MFSPLRRCLAGIAVCATAVALVPGCGGKPKDTGSGSNTPNPPAGYTGSKGGPPGGLPPIAPGGSGTGTDPGTAGGNDSSLPTLPAAGTILYPNGDAKTRTLHSNNLKQLALGLQNTTDVYGGLPAGVADKTGQIGLSWRVAVLPFVEHDNLYKQFKLDEPWNSEHNKKLINQMPKIFSPGGGGTPGLTYFRTFAGPDTAIGTPKPGRAGQVVIGGGFNTITDGTSNTAMIVEAADPVIWTKPDELVYDPSKPTPKVGGVFGNGFHVVFVDGVVRFLPKTLDDKLLRGIITARGGEIVNLP